MKNRNFHSGTAGQDIWKQISCFFFCEIPGIMMLSLHAYEDFGTYDIDKALILDKSEGWRFPTDEENYLRKTKEASANLTEKS